MIALIKDHRAVGIALFLVICTVSSLLVFPVINFAAGADTQQQLTQIMNSLMDIRSQVSAMREDRRVDRSDMLKRTNDNRLAVQALSDRLDNQDYSHQVLEVGKDHDHILQIQAQLDIARQEREQQQREARESAEKILTLERAIFYPVLSGILLIAVKSIWDWVRSKFSKAAELEHRQAMEATMQKIERKADAAYKAGNEHQQTEASIREHQDRQDKRLDDIEQLPSD